MRGKSTGDPIGVLILIRFRNLSLIQKQSLNLIRNPNLTRHQNLFRSIGARSLSRMFNRRFVDCAYPSAQFSCHRAMSHDFSRLAGVMKIDAMGACTIHKALRFWNMHSASLKWLGHSSKLFSGRIGILLRGSSTTPRRRNCGAQLVPWF